MNISKITLRILTILMLAAPAMSFSQGTSDTKTVNKYVKEIGQFDRLKVLDDVNVVYRCNPDSTGLAVFEGEPQFENAFILTLNKNTLKVQVNTEDLGQPGLPTLYLYSDFLTLVENSATFTTRVETLAPCAEFKAIETGNGTVTVDNLSANKVIAVLNTGNGTVNVSGTCVEAVLKMIGTGLIQADRLKADNVKCSILGSGTIGCWPLSSLHVRGIGSTKIYYKGDPKVKKTGGGKLFQIPEQRGELITTPQPADNDPYDDHGPVEEVNIIDEEADE